MSAWDGGPPRVAADLSSLSGDSLIGAKVVLRTLLGETITGEVCLRSYLVKPDSAHTAEPHQTTALAERTAQ
jgi:hypothetical protein